jgi:hypothetical protein
MHSSCHPILFMNVRGFFLLQTDLCIYDQSGWASANLQQTPSIASGCDDLSGVVQRQYVMTEIKDESLTACTDTKSSPKSAAQDAVLPEHLAGTIAVTYTNLPQ